MLVELFELNTYRLVGERDIAEPPVEGVEPSVKSGDDIELFELNDGAEEREK